MNEQARILVVDDNPDMLRLTSTQLRMEGYDVIEASTGNEGLRLALEHRPDIVLLDVMLPDVDGIEICRQIKQDANLDGVHVALYSAARIGPDDLVEGLEGGADDYIHQPITNLELLARVRAMVRTKRAEQALRLQAFQLSERIKELNCLYGVSSVVQQPNVTLKEVLQATVQLIPPGVQYPDITAVKIRLNELEVGSSNYQETPWQLECDITCDDQPAGVIKVCYLEDRPGLDEGPFLQEERDLLEAIAGLLGEFAEQAATEIALHESEATARVLLDALSDLAMLLDRDGLILYLNEAMARRLGRAVGDLVGLHAEALASQDLDGLTQEHFFQVVSGAEPVTFEYERDGRWFENAFFPIVDAQGKVSRVAILVHEFTERKRMEASLQESRQTYRDLVENIDEVVYTSAPDGTFTYISPRIGPLLGYTPAEVVGRRFSEVVDPRDKPAAAKALQTLQAGQGTQSRYRLETEAGTTRWIQTSSRPIFHEGQVQAIQGTLMDVTHHHRTEERVRRLSEAVEQSPSTTVITDVDGNIEYVNRRFSETTGYLAEEVIGHNPRILKSGLSPDSLYQEIWDTILSGEQWRGELVNKKKSGEFYWELASISPITNAEGRTTHFVKVAEDITRLKQIQLELQHERDYSRESEERLRSTLASMDELLFVLDKEGMFVDYYQPPSSVDLYVSPDAFIGRAVQDIMPPDVGEKFLAALNLLVDTGEVQQFDYSLDLAGKGQWYSARLSPRLDENGGFDGVTAVCHNITERVEAARHIQESLEEKEVLLREIHHRVKNNLQVVSSLLDMQSLTLENPVAIEALQDSRNRIRTMAFVHERLYQSENLSSIHVDEFVSSLVGQLLSVYEGPAPSIGLNVEVPDLKLNLDAAIPCGLIINELVSNAVKYAFPPGHTAGGEIRVALSPLEGGGLELLVGDNGVGLPEDLDPDTSMSMGLRLVVMLTRQLQGTLELERAGGATFRIKIPEEVWSPSRETGEDQ